MLISCIIYKVEYKYIAIVGIIITLQLLFRVIIKYKLLLCKIIGIVMSAILQDMNHYLGNVHWCKIILFTYMVINKTIPLVGATVRILNSDHSWDNSTDFLIHDNTMAPIDKSIPVFSYENNKIISENCIGPATIKHMGGDTTFDCSKPLPIMLFGPIEVIHFGESTFLIGNTPCKDVMELEHRFLSDCKEPLNVGLILMVSSLVLTNITLTLIFRYIWMTRVTTIRGYKILTKSKGIMTYTLKMEKLKMSDRITYVNQSRPSVTIDSSNIKELKYTKKTFLVAFLLLIHPTLQNSILNETAKKEITLNGSMVMMNTGEKYAIGKEVFIIPPLLYHSVLTPIYKTAETKEQMVKEWFCHDPSCNEYGPCSGYGQYGRLMSNTFGNRTNQLGDRGFVTRYCSWGSTGCFMKDGCWRWAVTSLFQYKSLYTVYETGTIRVNTRKDLTKSEHCTLRVGAVPEIPRLDTHSVVKTPEKDFYLCPFPTNKYTPTRAKLGDVQIFEDNKIMIAPDRMICTSLRIHGPSCSGGSVVMRSILEKCLRMPGNMNGFNIDMDTKGLRLTHRGLEPVELTCPNSVPITSGVTSCGVVAWKLWRLGNSAQEAKLSATTTAGLQSQSILVPGPCGIGHVFVRCGGSTTAISVSWLPKCANDPTIAEHVYLTEEEISVYKELTIEGSAEEYENQFNLLAIKKFFSRCMGVGLSGYGMFMLAGLVFLLLRK